MKASTLENTPVQTPALQLARFSGPHGYRFDGDTVHLHAMFALLHHAAHERSWALQLWACPAAPAAARDLSGHLVASVSLPPMGEIADEIEHFEVSAVAWPPAGDAERVMVLVLASGHPEHGIEVQDFAVYSRPQPFTQPRLSGSVGYRFDSDRVQISVERVENPRPASNRSGTLSLELWALPKPFAGGRFEGRQLAGVEIGTLDGQHELALQPIDLAFTPPPAGAWQIVLMLREWTADGFVTRDFASFTTPFVSATVVETAPAPVAAKPSVPSVEKPAASVALVAVKAPVPPAATALDAVKMSAPQIARAIVPAQPVKAPARAVAKGISVNTARVDELAAVKGLTKKIAESIVKKRPFTSLDDLCRVKGLGEKTLAKVRSSLRL